ncbi:MAG TPA: TetR/AcrR family transcriptional regulator [Cellulomonas sp.]
MDQPDEPGVDAGAAGQLAASTGRPDGRLVRGARRREKILATAVEVFGRQGFRGGSLREIADQVGISEPGLLHHFGSKTALLTATIAERDRLGAEQRERDEAAGRSAIDALRALVQHNVETPGLVALHVVLSAEATEPAHPAHTAIRDRYRAVRHHDVPALRDLQEQGRLHPDLDPEKIAPLITAVLDGLQLQWLLDPDQVDVAALFEEFLLALGLPQERDRAD